MDTSTSRVPHARDEKDHASEQQYSEVDPVGERWPRRIEVRHQIVRRDQKIPDRVRGEELIPGSRPATNETET